MIWDILFIGLPIAALIIYLVVVIWLGKLVWETIRFLWTEIVKTIANALPSGWNRKIF